MPNNYEYIASLLIKFLNGTLRKFEKRELLEWASASECNRKLLARYMDPDYLPMIWSEYHDLGMEKSWKFLTDHIPELRNAHKGWNFDMKDREN